MENSRVLAGVVDPADVKPPAAKSGAGPPHLKEVLCANDPTLNLLPQTLCFRRALYPGTPWLSPDETESVILGASGSLAPPIPVDRAMAA